MKKLYLFVTFMVLALVALARPVDSATARRVAEVYLHARGMRNTADLVDVTQETPFMHFYVFAAPEGGFVLVSGDDCVIPVLGYSTTSHFDAKDIPDHVREWYNAYDREIGRVVGSQAEGSQRSEAAEQWAALLDGDMPPAPLTAVSPLLTTTWNQSPYYNNLCPYHTASGERSVTGCVATATAQVMKYYNHPTTGYGSHTYTSDRTVNGVSYTFSNLTANFGSTTYQWSLMPNSLSGASSSTQVNAVATLMYHIGVADEMSYSPDASGARNYNYNGTLEASTQTSLMKYFKYRPDMATLMRADYSDVEYGVRLRAEIDQGRPVLMSGSNVSAGHSFVFDGYDNSGNVHVNWGWGGYHDGYFAIGSLNPGVGGIGGNSSGTYNMSNVALVGIRPNNNWSTTGTTTITATSTGNGTVSGGGSYSFDDTVTLRATPSAGYRFSGWSDGSKFNPREIVANGGSYTFTATFEAIAGDTLHYCPGNYMINNYGATSGACTWGIRLPSSLLTSVDSLYAVQLYVADAGTYSLTVYTGTSHSTTAATATATFVQADENQWKTITLATPVAATSDLWIVFTSSDAAYPASYTYGSGVAGAFLWGSSLGQYGVAWDVTAMIKGIFNSNGSSDPNPCYITTFPYTENFNDTTADCWEVIDADADGNTWSLYSGTYGYNNTICIGIQYADNCDDWLMAPPINIAGNYSVAWKASIRSTSYPETYQVLWYDGTDTTVLFQETLSSTTYVNRSANFTVPTASSGRIVFRYISNDMYYLFLDDIVISEVVPPTQYTVTVTSNNTSWGTVTGGGAYTAGATATLTATPAAGYQFVQWQDGNTQNPRTVTVNGNVTYMATFEAIPPTQYTVTVTSNNTSWGTVTGGGTYTAGATATLTATPAAGYQFVQWQDGNTQNPRTVTVNGNVTYMATFEAIPPTQYTVTVTSNNTLWGTVTGGGTYTAGATATLTATPTAGYQFVQWQDGNTQNPRTVTVNGDVTYSATFEAIPPETHTLTVVSADATMGQVEGSGTYEAGAQVTIRAIAADGYHFTLWHDGDTENPRTVTVTTDITYTAYFAPNVGIGDVTGNGTTVVVNGRTIMVDGAQAEFYDMLGRRMGGGSEITVSAAGVYLVRIGTVACKVVIK